MEEEINKYMLEVFETYTCCSKLFMKHPKLCVGLPSESGVSEMLISGTPHSEGVT
jgi:hypothetical protein